MGWRGGVEMPHTRGYGQGCGKREGAGGVVARADPGGGPRVEGRGPLGPKGQGRPQEDKGDGEDRPGRRVTGHPEGNEGRGDRGASGLNPRGGTSQRMLMPRRAEEASSRSRLPVEDVFLGSWSNTFQNRIVSSPAAETTVLPSGDRAVYRTRDS